MSGIEDWWSGTSDSLSNSWSNFTNWLGNTINGTPNYQINLGNTTGTIDLSDLYANGVTPTAADLSSALTERLGALGITENNPLYQKAFDTVNSNTWGQNVGGLTGNNGLVQSLGGWGNVLGGIGQLGSIYNGLQQIGIAKDYLSLAKQSYNTNKALMQTNLDNSVSAYNTSLADRYRARAYAETGDNTSYDDQIEERKLKSTSL